MAVPTGEAVTNVSFKPNANFRRIQITDNIQLWRHSIVGKVTATGYISAVDDVTGFTAGTFGILKDNYDNRTTPPGTNNSGYCDLYEGMIELPATAAAQSAAPGTQLTISGTITAQQQTLAVVGDTTNDWLVGKKSDRPAASGNVWCEVTLANQ